MAFQNQYWHAYIWQNKRHSQISWIPIKEWYKTKAKKLYLTNNTSTVSFNHELQFQKPKNNLTSNASMYAYVNKKIKFCHFYISSFYLQTNHADNIFLNFIYIPLDTNQRHSKNK